MAVGEKSGENYINTIYHGLSLVQSGPMHRRVLAVLRYLSETLEGFDLPDRFDEGSQDYGTVPQSQSLLAESLTLVARLPS